MNNFCSTANSPGLLKKVYKTGAAKGPVAQMSQNNAMLSVIRKKRDALKT